MNKAAYSIINGNVLNLLISLRELEKSFEKEFKILQESNKNTCYDKMCDKFYDGYVAMQDAFKSMLAETTEISIQKH